MSTRWSMVAAAVGEDRAAQAALEELCGAYWYPIYAHVRRSGRDVSAAQDLTQGFFARLLEKQVLAHADRARGRFRTFLLAALRNYLHNEHARETAQKRGGGFRSLSLDFDHAESRYHAELAHSLTAEREFERQWALAVLEQALASLADEHARQGQSELFDTIAPFLTKEEGGPGYASAAERLGMSVPAVKMAASRLRKKYRAAIREEILRTVADPADVDEELQSLFAALEP